MDDLEYRRYKLKELLQQIDPTTEAIIGIAPETIPWACWLANLLNLPAGYIRLQPKGYGTQRQVEGTDIENKCIVLIVDNHNIEPLVDLLLTPARLQILHI